MRRPVGSALPAARTTYHTTSRRPRRLGPSPIEKTKGARFPDSRSKEDAVGVEHGIVDAGSGARTMRICRRIPSASRQQRHSFQETGSLTPSGRPFGSARPPIWHALVQARAPRSEGGLCFAAESRRTASAEACFQSRSLSVLDRSEGIRGRFAVRLE